MMELFDTVEWMVSIDYKKRFLAEYAQLRIRYKKLERMKDAYLNGTLEFTPTCPMEIYERQLKAMEDYLAVLEERAILEEVDIGAI